MRIEITVASRGLSATAWLLFTLLLTTLQIFGKSYSNCCPYTYISCISWQVADKFSDKILDIKGNIRAREIVGTWATACVGFFLFTYYVAINVLPHSNNFRIKNDIPLTINARLKIFLGKEKLENSNFSLLDFFDISTLFAAYSTKAMSHRQAPGIKV